MADGEGATPAEPIRPAEVALLASVFVVAACGLLYELAAGALASYLLGDSVLQFSTVIGTYLFAMGLGSWASRFVTRQLVAQFLRIELLVGLLGGLMPALLFVAHGTLPAHAVAPFRVLLYGMVGLIGVLVGLEIPLVMRILKSHFAPRWALSELVSQVLTFDYLGALVVAIAFPILFVPHLGLVRTGVFFGLLNAAVAVWALLVFRAELRRFELHAAACAVVGPKIVLLAPVWWAGVLLFGLAGGLIFLLLRPDPQEFGRQLASEPAAPQPTAADLIARPLGQILRLPAAQLALAAMVIGQATMVLVMSVTSLHMDHNHHGGDEISLVFMAHTIGMFALSMVNGAVIDRLGRKTAIWIGVALLIAGSLIAAAALMGWWWVAGLAALAVSGAALLLCAACSDPLHHFFESFLALM